MGPPKKIRKLLDKDSGKVRAFIYGAKSGPELGKAAEGTVTSIYNDIKITYNNTDEFTIINTIAISENGKAISLADGIKVSGTDDGYTVLLVGSGVYHFTADKPLGQIKSIQ